MSSSRAASAIKEVINFKNAKRTSFFLMIMISIYHGFLMTKSGGNLCKSLLSDGRSGPGGEFRPYSCMIHTYSSRDSHKCFKRLAPWGDVVRLYFVGDSRLKKLFNAFVYHINDEVVGENTTSEASISNNFQYVAGEVDLRFFYHDEITDDTLELVKSWIGSTNLSNVTESNVRNKNNDISTPTHLIISMGTKTIQHYNRSEDGLLEYMNGVKRLTSVLEELKFARCVWMLQDPVAESLLSKELKIITNDLIDKYNEFASTAIGVEIWSSNRLIALKVGFPAINWNCRQLQMLSTSNSDKIASATSILDYKEGTAKNNVCLEMPTLSDGYHVSDKAMKENVQILLNLYCNNQMKFSDGTCCRGSEPITPVQEKCFIFYAICVLSTLLCFMYNQFISRGKPCTQVINFRRIFLFFRKTAEAQPYVPVESEPDGDNENNNDNTDTTSSLFVEFYELTSALSKFGAIMMYFFICDRTILFMKANKRYTNLSFFLPIIYCFVLGLFFSGPTKRSQVNHLDITREWKGWMQLYLLIYHFTDSYRVTPIFMSARLVVSSYLFLSGYGHFCYFWRKPVPQINWLKLLNYRRCSREFCSAWKALWQILHRYLIVIYRFNFFVFGLCLVMNRGYLAYYFIPLVSFWFTVTMIVCVIFPRVSGQKVSENQNNRDNIDCNDNNSNHNITSNHNNNNALSTHTNNVTNITATPIPSTTASTSIPSNATATSIATTNNSYNYNRNRYFNHQYFTTNYEEYPPDHQYIESDDEIYFHQSPRRSSLNMNKSFLLPTSSPSSLLSSTDTVIGEISDYIPCHSSSSRKLTAPINYNLHKGHYKALSLGTGFDLCQNYSLTNTDTNSSIPCNPQFRHYQANQKLVGHRLHRSVVKSRGRLGPPLTEDLIRKFQCIVLPLKKKISPTASSTLSATTTITTNKKRTMIMNQKLKQPLDSTTNTTIITTSTTNKCRRYFKSICFIHCSRIRLTYVLMIIKFIGLICFIESLYRSRGFFHWLFFSGPQKYIFQYHREYTQSAQKDVTNNDEKIWFFRWSIDRYSAVYGMIFAFLCESLRQIGVLEDTVDDNSGDNYAVADYLQDIKQSDEIRYTRLPLSSKIYDLTTTVATNNNDNHGGNVNNHKINSDDMDTDYHKRLQKTNHKTFHCQNDYNDESYEYLNHSTSYEIKQYDNIFNSTVQYSNHLQKPVNSTSNLSSSSSSSTLLSHLNEHNNEISYFSMLLYKCFSPLGLTVLGIIGLMFSCIYVFACSNRETCLHIHAYICLIPIISYILVRNSFSSLRRIYSIFFAWIGDMSLELFIAQYHIWLSADAYGILVLLPGFPLINLTLTSFIFICICHEVHILTRRLQNYIIPNSPLKLVRNILIFTLVFHLITNSTLQMIQWDFS
ncbi:unnamed protein product [Schistosoma margrebowiei]|uniref:Cas1p 10 TM acyl transferase domain-containing protein n=1 Tax=Schistosoma margrebowiei TaxID=48269 RepID=A0AA84ZPY0_9TREM|nr:unnamed protein product [Schistosoma margrebowiei]